MSRKAVEEVLSADMTREVWTGNYEKVFPVSIQDFDLSAVLPAVFYMFRYANRRGKGKFLATFTEGVGNKTDRRRSATIESVVGKLSRLESFEGFQGETEQAILGDLLLCFCLENSKHALGRTEKVQRVSPAHYMSSWVDLPEHVGHLRYVPEMIVAMLADQEGGFVQQSAQTERTWFAVGRGFDRNVLLGAFHSGMRIQGDLLADHRSDQFDEIANVGIDQLLMIRMAQTMGQAPDKLRGGEGERISNQRPISERAARHFSEDIRRFVRAYAGVIPRQSLVSMLESCMSVGLTSILGSVIDILIEWAETGVIRNTRDQFPPQLFVDASNGTHSQLRSLAENSMDDFMRRVERLPTILMAARLLDRGARYTRTFREQSKDTRPYATEWLNLLGDILHERNDESSRILDRLDEDSQKLAEKLKAEAPDVAKLLDDCQSCPNAVWRMAEALTLLMGRENTQKNLLKCLDSSLLSERPNGVAAKRRGRDSGLGKGKKTREIRSLVFTDSVLDYLVHLHLLHSGNNVGMRTFSFKEFLRILRERYGFCVDEEPTGMTISNDLLRANRGILERRLRDLGLLVGVNDAEAMKRLRPRFTPNEVDLNGAI